ncbi:uncharacterized protein BO80DRAFT_468702 [Aspergillus ibericus CBS 121593]|uniref:Uncharacterized protein n=1 Tax=Aspergillus ibericus CBS 121593 TaxID=1448316 RepID=A0A395GN24_9EURO|nr:hypothetical protein BO80DRAFT_468702 [Aspergillus ibericus CBS 121593]RAK96358.1 hypothetical protein BO80DRAFT_468702 [Aspergillus ibericus CBS 121593]
MTTTLPRRPSTWARAVRREKAENTTIHDIDLSSASTIQEEQYLMLRVLWKPQRRNGLKLAKFGLDEWTQKAATMLESSASWAAYIASFSGDSKEGIFSLPWFYQKQVAHVSPNPIFRPNVAISPPRTRGQLRNIAAGIKKLSFDVPTEPPSTPKIEPEVEFDDTPEEPSAAQDTPPGERSYGPKEFLNLNYPRTKDEQIVNTALVDFLNAFIKLWPVIVFSSPKAETKYSLRKDESPGFQTLHGFGGWDTERVGDMKDIGKILLAIALRAEMEREQSAPQQ